MEPMTPDELLRLPVDERAALIFLAAMGDQFVSTLDLLAAQLPDCGPERLRRVVRGLEARGLLARKKIYRVGTEFRVLAKLPDVAMQGDRFVIPQLKPQPHLQVPRSRPEVSTVSIDAPPLVGNVPVRKPPVLFFPRGENFDFTWHVSDAKGDPVKDCNSVRATLFHGRSTMVVGGVPVRGFNNKEAETVGDGDYMARITIGATVAADSEYTLVVDVRRGGRHFGHHEVPAAVTD